jgi:hypothetical protein
MATKKRKTTKTSKRKTTKGKSGNAARLRKIVSKAKEIRKKRPSIKWTTAIKEASKELF